MSSLILDSNTLLAINQRSVWLLGSFILSEEMTLLVAYTVACGLYRCLWLVPLPRRHFFLHESDRVCDF
jgi:hypothetical protein